ncbi:MAG: hypothetical protein NC823_02035, partial [Candidatus Omnitrophica bacterium]|nr:hypothetical protein [Candidatus Omnitrophota bacterium]
MKILRKECRTCSQARQCQESFLSWIFFAIGLIATIAIRIVNLLQAYHPFYAKLAWYIGILGFFLFFVYKFIIDRKRTKFISQAGLLNKVQAGQNLTEEDQRLVRDILCALSSRRDTINYFLIFFTS